MAADVGPERPHRAGGGEPLVEEHLDLCLAAGINHEGINAEVAKGQWEFQIFGKGSKKAADEVWLARYLLLRLTVFRVQLRRPEGDAYWMKENIELLSALAASGRSLEDTLTEASSMLAGLSAAAGLVAALARGHGLARVDDDGHEVVVPAQGIARFAPVQQRQAGLGGDVDGHGVGHLQAVGAVELLVVEEQGTERTQFGLVRQGQGREEGAAGRVGLPGRSGGWRRRRGHRGGAAAWSAEPGAGLLGDHPPGHAAPRAARSRLKVAP